MGLTTHSTSWSPQRGPVAARGLLDLAHHRRQRLLGRDGEHYLTAVAPGLALDAEAEEVKAVVDVGD